MQTVTEPYTTGAGYIGYPLPLPELPKEFSLDTGEVLLLKDEFHVTLICPEVAGHVAQTDGRDVTVVEKEVFDFFNAFVAETPLTFGEYINEFRIVTREERKTVVVMCSVPKIKSFFRALQSKFDITLDTQPTHVTLYTLQKNAGIGIWNQEELSQTEAISNEQTQKIFNLLT